MNLFEVRLFGSLLISNVLLQPCNFFNKLWQMFSVSNVLFFKNKIGPHLVLTQSADLKTKKFSTLFFYVLILCSHTCSNNYSFCSSILRLVGHWLHHPEHGAHCLILWEPTHGQRGRGRPRTSYVNWLKRDTGSTGKLAAMMNDRNVGEFSTAVDLVS